VLSTASIEELGLKHKDRLLISSVCSKFENNDISPKSISAALVQLYILLCGKKSTNAKIIKLFAISNMTLYRTKKKIEKKANPILKRLIEQNL
jgi:DNA invertase Pin-like site-specific DNA recombinase